MKENELESRVSVVETSLEDLKRTVDKGFKYISDELRKFSDDRKPNYMLWVASGTLMCSLFAGLYILIGLRIDGASSPIKLRLQEVETQFNADAQARNIQFSEQQRLNSIMWNALHSAHVEMPEYPTGPFYQPNISKAAPPTIGD